MGVVYRARHISLDRIVAVKTIRCNGTLGSQPDSVRRFQNEAEAAASLDHPNIVPVYEVGSQHGFHYLSMKFIDGNCLAYDSFSNVVGGGIARCRAIASVMAKVANAVHYAHQRGVLHRDLKLANILIDSDGTPFVTYFGLTKLLNTKGLDITRTGPFLGTPAFMSPEQASGHSPSISVATDIYGLGAVLYALLTGKAPFEGESHVPILDLVRQVEPVSPARMNSSVDKDLATICLKCLRKSVAHRYSSAAAMQADLDHWLAGEPITARRVGNLERIAKWLRRHLSAILPFIVLFAVLGIALQVTAGGGWLVGCKSVQ